ncbi:MAG TPA: hypothetical protein VK943_01515 [Arenibaculum sp.]|nr:hypothetical protein [Arenibaculum sp.]
MTEYDDDARILQGIPAAELQEFLAWRERVRGTNISGKTLLATDYLNHFNEIVMLVEMTPDMPMMVEECRAWQPKGYREHFRDSGFSEKELAIAAYDRVPGKFRAPLEATIEQMNEVVHITLQRIEHAREQGNEERLRADCTASVAVMQRLIQVANGIIHGAAGVMQQSEIDDYLGR